jgi:hypothetical protein
MIHVPTYSAYCHLCHFIMQHDFLPETADASIDSSCVRLMSSMTTSPRQTMMATNMTSRLAVNFILAASLWDEVSDAQLNSSAAAMTSFLKEGRKEGRKEV